MRIIKTDPGHCGICGTHTNTTPRYKMVPDDVPDDTPAPGRCGDCTCEFIEGEQIIIGDY